MPRVRAAARSAAWTTTSSTGPELAEHRRHLGLPQHREAHASHRRLRSKNGSQFRPAQLGQASPADGLEARGGVEGEPAGRLGHQAEADVELGAEIVGFPGLGRTVGGVQDGDDGPGVAQQPADPVGEGVEGPRGPDHDPALGQVARARPGGPRLRGPGPHWSGRPVARPGAAGRRPSPARRSRRWSGRCCAGTPRGPGPCPARRSRRPGRRRSRARRGCDCSSATSSPRCMGVRW